MSRIWNDKEFIMAALILVSASILAYLKILPTEIYVQVLGYILAYYFGKTRNEVKTLGIRHGQLKRLGILLLGAGMFAVGEHLVNYGVTWDVDITCHGLYGLILILAGWILASKRK